VKTWWRKRSLRFRLTAAFALISTATLCTLGAVCLWILQWRLSVLLNAELDEDFDTIEAGVRIDPDGRFVWSTISPEENPKTADKLQGVQFEIRSLTGTWLFSDSHPIHWNPTITPTPYKTRYFSTEVPNVGRIRVLEKTGRLKNGDYILRVFESESDSLQPVSELASVLAIGLPITILLASAGGYLVAGRILMPLWQMAARARRITADSLSDRLPIGNPDDEIGQLGAIINETLARLEQSFATLRRFAADASHELRTPVAAIRAMGEVAMETHANDPVRLAETLGQMLEESTRLGDLIDALLVLARADSGKLPVTLKPIDAVVVAAEACDLVSVLADEKSQQLTLKRPKTDSAFAMADHELLRLALLNLLDNAIRYSPPGSPIMLSVESLGASVAIDVADRGPGIPAGQQEKVFERFYRTDEARSRAKGGTGLGLAIAKLVLHSQHGSLRLTSQEGKGSIFRIELPAAS
jgi:heavy metal sensor kinase